MAVLRSHHFYSGVITGGAWTTLYTVPAGKLAVIKTLTSENNWSSPQDVAYRLDGTAIFYRKPLTAFSTAGGYDQLLTWIALAAGQVLAATPTGAQPIAITVSGSLLFV